MSIHSSAPQGATAQVQPRSAEPIKIQHLGLIKWKDEQGQTQRFYLMDKIAHEWRTLGQLLGLSLSKLQSIGDEYRDKPKECCRAVLGLWLDNPPDEYPITWHGLLELLEDSQLGQVVSDLSDVLDKAKLR